MARDAGLAGFDRLARIVAMRLGGQVIVET
jgi:hypothetical protein